jgi:hypothetical protein
MPATVAKKPNEKTNSQLFAIWHKAGGNPEIYPKLSGNVDAVHHLFETIGWDFEKFPVLPERYCAILGIYGIIDALGEKKLTGSQTDRNPAARSNRLLLSLCKKNLTPKHVKRLEIIYGHDIHDQNLMTMIEQRNAGTLTDPALIKRLDEYEQLCEADSPDSAPAKESAAGATELFSKTRKTIAQRRTESLTKLAAPLRTPQEQLELMLGTMSAIEVGFSHSKIPLGDFTSSLPLWVSDQNNQFRTTTPEIITRHHSYNGTDFTVDIKPIILTTYTKTGKKKPKLRYPGEYEHIVLMMLFKMATDQTAPMALDISVGNGAPDVGVFIRFSITSLRNRLAKKGHGSTIAQLEMALRVLHGTNIEIFMGESAPKTNYFGGNLLHLEEAFTTEDGLCHVRFNRLITQEYLHNYFTVIDEDILMKQAGFLERWFYTMLANQFRQADGEQVYAIHLTRLLSTSPLAASIEEESDENNDPKPKTEGENWRVRKKIARIRKMFGNSIRDGVLSSKAFTKEEISNPPANLAGSKTICEDCILERITYGEDRLGRMTRIVEITWGVRPSDAVTQDIYRSNIFLNRQHVLT